MGVKQMFTSCSLVTSKWQVSACTQTVCPGSLHMAPSIFTGGALPLRRYRACVIITFRTTPHQQCASIWVDPILIFLSPLFMPSLYSLFFNSQNIFIYLYIHVAMRPEIRYPHIPSTITLVPMHTKVNFIAIQSYLSTSNYTQNIIHPYNI